MGLGEQQFGGPFTSRKYCNRKAVLVRPRATAGCSSRPNNHPGASSVKCGGENVFAGGTRRDIKGRGLSNYLGQRTFAKLIGWRIFLLGKPGEDSAAVLRKFAAPRRSNQKKLENGAAFALFHARVPTVGR